MIPYNVRLNKVFNEVKSYVYNERKRTRNTCIFVDPSDFNNVSRYFGGSLAWHEKQDLMNLIENRINGVNSAEHACNDTICIWF